MYRATRSARVELIGLAAVGAVGFVGLWNVLLPQGPLAGMSSGVLVWWVFLCTISIINICGWRLSAAAIASNKENADPSLLAFQRWQLVLSAVYVAGCCFRSAFPRADVQRLGLLDSWISSVLVGRSVATIAELCFVTQWALLLRRTARDAGVRPAVILSWLLVPLIAVAEVCSWYAVLTTCYLGNFLEESLWATTAVLLIMGCLLLWSHCRGTRRWCLAGALVLAGLYVTFMCGVDIPMYLSRWLADESSGRVYLTLGQGVQDAWSRRVVTFSWQQWGTEIPWMSLYFSVAVWCSIAMAHFPHGTQQSSQSQW